MVDDVISVALRGKDESFSRTLKAGQKELRATDKALNRASGAFDQNAAANQRAAKAMRASKQALIGSHRNAAIMPGVIQKLNGTMIELAITMGSFSLIASPWILLTKTAIDYNSAIEKTKLGIASLITASGELTDSQGRVLQGQEALNAAMVQSSKIQKQIQVDNLRTNATFQQLVETFQIALGPGLSADLTLEEIQKLSVGVAQAGAALGVPMNQLSEEIRSLIQGTGTLKNSRIEFNIGLNNAMIRTARDQGKLFGTLQKHLAAFNEAGKVAAEQWEGVWSNTVDAVEMSIGQGMQPLFEALKGDLKAVQDAFVEIKVAADGTESIQIRPEVLESFAALGEGIHDALGLMKALVGGVRAATDALGIGGLMAVLFGLRALWKSN